MFTMQSFLLLIRRTAAIAFIAIVCAPILVCADSIDTVIDSLFKLRHLSGVSISPDGRQVAWVQTREDAATGGVTYSVYTSGVERPGAPAKRITAGTGTAEYMEHEIVWSPDSKRLAFLSDAEKKGQAQLYISDIAGGRPQRLTSLTGALAKPSWSPDGKTIALLFIENAARAAVPLEAMTAETGVIEQQIYHQRLTTIDVASGKTRQLTPAGLYVYEYDWSSDGRTFVATAAPGPGDNNWYIAQIYTIALRDGKTTSIFKTPMQIANPRWSPDGKRVAFIGGLMSDEGV